MARKIIFPIIIFLTVIAAANVRSVPLLVLAYAEVIFAGLMIALALFQRSRIKPEPVNRLISISKDQSCDCSIRVKNTSLFPVNRFRLEASYGYEGEDESEIVLYGGTDKSEGFLKVLLENEHCGINRLKLNKIQSYDFFLLSSFPKKLNEMMQIAVFPDETLKMHIILRSSDINTAIEESYEYPVSTKNGGSEPEDIRKYREGDPVRSIYWKQSAKMNELWVKDFMEDTKLCPIIEVSTAKLMNADRDRSDTFYRILYALMSGILDVSDNFILRCACGSDEYRNYHFSDKKLLRLILFSLYMKDLNLMHDHYAPGDLSPGLTLRFNPTELMITADNRLLKIFDTSVSDDEINNTILII